MHNKFYNKVIGMKPGKYDFKYIHSQLRCVHDFKHSVTFPYQATFILCR